MTQTGWLFRCTGCHLDAAGEWASLLYGLTSERKLVEELRMHLTWRWFTSLGFDQEIPHHSTFSKNRHGRFQESKLFEARFEQIVLHWGSGIGAGQAPVDSWRFALLS